MDNLKINSEMIEQIDSSLLVFDTSALIRIYDYAPNVYEFCCECLSRLESKIYISPTISEEFRFQYKKHLENANKYTKTLFDDYTNELYNSKNKLIGILDNCLKYNYPDIDSFKKNVNNAMQDLIKQVDSYDAKHPEISCFNSQTREDFISPIVFSRTLGNFLSREEMYKITIKADQEGVYLGSMDKNKKGLKKYNDLFIFEEIKKIAKAEKKNVIFLTNEEKSDFFEVKNGKMKKSFAEEFFADTGQAISIINSPLNFLISFGKSIGISIIQTKDFWLQKEFEKIVNDKNIHQENINKISQLDPFKIESKINNELGYKYSFDFVEDVDFTDIEFSDAYIVEINQEKQKLLGCFNYSLQVSGLANSYMGYDSEEKETYYDTNLATFVCTVSCYISLSPDEEGNIITDDCFNLTLSDFEQIER